jgi:hypothetical protein
MAAAPAAGALLVVGDAAPAGDTDVETGGATVTCDCFMAFACAANATMVAFKLRNNVTCEQSSCAQYKHAYQTFDREKALELLARDNQPKGG